MQTLLAGQCGDYTPCPFGGGVCRWCQKPEGEHPAKDPARARLEDVIANLPLGLIEAKDYPERLLAGLAACFANYLIHPRSPRKDKP